MRLLENHPCGTVQVYKTGIGFMAHSVCLDVNHLLYTSLLSLLNFRFLPLVYICKTVSILTRLRISGRYFLYSIF